MNYISLGSTCGLAYQLQKLNLKKESLPFDWIRSNSISSVLYLIKNNFDGFLDNLIHIKNDDKFPEVDEDFNEDLINIETNIYRNEKFCLGFFHDFNKNTSFNNVKEKYDRRIKRFYEKVKSPSIFIRDELNFKQKDIEIYNELYEELIKYNNQNQFILIINTFKNQNIDISKLNPNIKIFIDEEKILEWQHQSIIKIIKDLI
jgi:hypothetical protein